MIDNEDYQKIKSETKIYFQALNPVVSPALGELVKFSIEGFNHIGYKKGNTVRDKPHQIDRFRSLSVAVKLIQLSTTYQEYEELVKEISIRRRRKRIRVMRLVQYWGIIAIMKKGKFKVILRRIGNGALCFWSVIPYYSTSKERDGKYMKGNPEED